MRKVLITGVSSGLGAALAEACLERGDSLYAMGRHDNKALHNMPNYHFLPVDLSDVELLPNNIREFLRHHHFELAILNAGQLGEIKELGEISLSELRQIFDLNVLANKQIIDALDLHAKVDQVAAVSSGAAINGHKGWGSYALSKAALNMLVKLYAEEKPETHFSAIAPGVVMTPMLQQLFDTTNPARFPSVQRLREGSILHPEAAADRFLKACEVARTRHPSGSFLDVRTMGI